MFVLLDFNLKIKYPIQCLKVTHEVVMVSSSPPIKKFSMCNVEVADWKDKEWFCIYILT